jgi:hypothetical protein
MRTYWPAGLGGERLGQGDLLSVGLSLFSTGIKTGLSWYQGKRAADEQKKAQDAIAANQAAVQASQDAAAKAQQKAVAAQQAAAAPISGTQSTILGIKSSTFYIGTGILVAGAIAATLIATGASSKKPKRKRV